MFRVLRPVFELLSIVLDDWLAAQNEGSLCSDSIVLLGSASRNLPANKSGFDHILK